jgi:hypothetical protein
VPLHCKSDANQHGFCNAIAMQPHCGHDAKPMQTVSVLQCNGNAIALQLHDGKTP